MKEEKTKLVGLRHALQSDEWASFQNSIGNKSVKIKGINWLLNGSLELGHKKIGYIDRRLYFPYGPNCQNMSDLKEALQKIKIEAKKHNATYARIEPTAPYTSSELKKLGLKPAPKSFQPKHTLIVDLSKDKEQLLYDMQATVRRLSRQFDQKKFTFKISYKAEDIKPLLEMMKVTSNRANVIFRSPSYLTKMLETLGPSKTLGVAYCLHDNKPMSGALIYDDKISNTRLYMHAGSLLEARNLRSNVALVIFLIFDAQTKGFKHFDFYGVCPAEAKDHPWAGFSSFKRSFGGEEVTYSGTWELPVNKFNYALLTTLRSIVKLFKKKI